MGWYELRWVMPRTDVELVSGHLDSIGALGLQEEFLPGEEPPPRQPWDTGPMAPLPKNVLLKAWWEDTELEQAKQDVLEIQTKMDLEHVPTWHNVEEEDWENSWKVHFSRRVFSDSLAISPSWLAEEGDIVLDPGTAFGTGEHATTLACIDALVAWAGNSDNKTCLDVGCGSGILALVAAKLGMDVVGIDIDPDAVEAAKKHAELNQLQISYSDVPLHAVYDTFGIAKYDIVLANLFAEVLVALAEDIIQYTGRYLALAGILVEKSPMVEKAFASMQLIEKKQDGEWVSLWYALAQR